MLDMHVSCSRGSEGEREFLAPSSGGAWLSAITNVARCTGRALLSLPIAWRPSSTRPPLSWRFARVESLALGHHFGLEGHSRPLAVGREAPPRTEARPASPEGGRVEGPWRVVTFGS